jgi:hypothetical protein
MGLRISLGLSITSRNRIIKAIPQLQEDGFDILLSQSDDAIITQSGIFIVIQSEAVSQEEFTLLTQSEDTIITQDGRFIIISPTVMLYELQTQDGFTLITQDGRIIEVAS